MAASLDQINWRSKKLDIKDAGFQVDSVTRRVSNLFHTKKMLAFR
jgi:hypothetical protein